MRNLRNAFTLFEVIVALGLSVVLMGMIAFAMQFYAVQLNVRDSEARRSQLARAILRMMAEDLQACVYPEEFDSAALAEILSASSSGSASGSSESGGDDIEVTDADVETEGFSDTLILTERPGLVGSQYQIQFDVSRLPRLEEYLPMLADPADVGLTDPASDVKSVSYYVQQAGLTGATDEVEGLSGGDNKAGGLVRRALSREITAYATEGGDLLRLDQSGDMLAPEVVGLEFAYFDGTQWLYEWNSDVEDGLPRAVQIRLTLSRADAVESDLLVDPDIPTGDVYDLIVRLPMAREVSAGTDEAADLSAAGI